MPFSDFIMGLPALDLPFPKEVVQSRAIRSEQGLCVFFTFLQDMNCRRTATARNGERLWKAGSRSRLAAKRGYVVWATAMTSARASSMARRSGRARG